VTDERVSTGRLEKNGLDSLLQKIHATFRLRFIVLQYANITSRLNCNVSAHVTYFAEDGNEIINNSFYMS